MEAAVVHKTHPVVLVAAASVTALSLAGIGAIFGVIPTGGKAPNPELAVAAGAPAAAPMTAPTAAPLVTSAAAATTAAPVARPETATTLSLPAGSSVRIDTPAHKPRPVETKPAETVARTAHPPVREHAVYREPTVAPPSGGLTRVANDEAPTVYAERAPRPVADARAQAPANAVAPPTCHECGTIAGIREVKKDGEANGIGAVAGGLLGGVAGRQIGGGRGRDAMTVIGAIGGAVAGHAIEKNQRSSNAYEVSIRFDDGTTQTITQDSAPSWRQGDRVRLSNGQISPL